MLSDCCCSMGLCHLDNMRLLLGLLIYNKLCKIFYRLMLITIKMSQKL